jgi:hypothetical protein
MKSKISLITLGVKDISSSLKFYRDGLGFKTHNYKEGEDHVMFELDGSWLGLFPKDQLAEGAGLTIGSNDFSGIVFAHNVKTEQEVNQVTELARKAGAKILKEPEKVFWGGYSSHFSDPDGYIWSAAYNPFTDLS